MTRYVDGVGSTNRKHSIKCGRPCRHIGILVDRRVGGFLDEITAEDHDPAAVIIRHYNDQVRGGVATARVSDRHLAVSEVDDSVLNGAFRRTQRRDRAVDLLDIGTVAQRVGAKLVSGRRKVLDNLGAQ